MRWGHIRILYEAPTDYTKSQKTIQGPDRIYKAPKRLHTDLNILDKDKILRQRPQIFNKSSNTYEFNI